MMDSISAFPLLINEFNESAMSTPLPGISWLACVTQEFIVV